MLFEGVVQPHAMALVSSLTRVRAVQARQEARKQAETAAQEAAAHELALMRRQLASAQSALATTEKV